MAGVWRRKFQLPEIELTGEVWSQKLGIEGAGNNTFEIKKYGYPEETFPGVISISKEYSSTFCRITLYATDDVLKRLAIMLSGMSKGDTVKFELSMITDGQPIRIGESKEFNIAGYRPVFRKAYS